MSRVRYIADTMEEAWSAARREHGARARIVRAGPGGGRAGVFEVVVETAGATPNVHARRAARLALSRAVAAAALAAGEAREAVASVAAQVAEPGRVGAVLARLAARLRAQALPEEFAGHVVARAREAIEQDAGAPERALEQAAAASAVESIAALLPVAAPTEPMRRGAEGRPTVIAVAGATGVGKTTTVAKLAAGLAAGRGLRIGFVAADAFRVGAVDQLRTYASILGAPLRAADGPSAVRESIAALGGCDVVLVDTPGRGHRDQERIAEIAEILRAARPDETHLLLPASASGATLARAVAAFAPVGATRLVLSKLDESEGLGALVEPWRRAGAGASWFTTGQEVPDDLERADARAFARRLVEGIAEPGAAA
ncbi:MAG: hypothetical protein U0625_11005 [Phycisphaerales bacterium]